MVVSARGGTFKAATSKHATMMQVDGLVGRHSYAVEERAAFASHLNYYLGRDEYLGPLGVFPINPDSDDLFRVISDGIVMAKLINLAQRDTIDERTLNYPKAGKALNPWEIKENQNLVINSAKAIGCSIVNIHAQDLMETTKERKEYLVLGMIWQIVKIHLLSQINLKQYPELIRLLNEGEELEDLLKLPPEDILLRWFNYHLKRSGSERVVTNFDRDLKDSIAYSQLLNVLEPGCVGVAADDPSRALAVINGAKSFGVPCIIQPSDIVRGNKRLNLAFCAQIFNTRHGLVIDEEERKKVFDAAGMLDDDENDSREERVFRFWLNSLNLANGERYINNLYDDLSDGILLLETIERVAPGTVDFKKVNRPTADKPLSVFKRAENCNYAVKLGQAMGLSLPGLGGIDIANRNKKLTLGMIWQLMRINTINTLKQIGGGRAPSDQDILNWANRYNEEHGKATRISSFKDSSIASGLFLLDLLSCIEARAINADLVTAGTTDDERKNNARYVISVARRLGAIVFLTWEDIRDVRPKMIMLLVASIMHIALTYRPEK